MGMPVDDTHGTAAGEDARRVMVANNDKALFASRPTLLT
jgi:hypothetical protein